MSRKREPLKTGTSQRIMRPLKYEVILAEEVIKAFCRFWIRPEEREALVKALCAFGEATSTRINHFTEISQGIYVASAKANEMKRSGDSRGVEARKELLRVLYLLRYQLIPEQGYTPAAEEWPDLIDDNPIG